MRRIGAGLAVIVVALTLLTPPATAQNGSASLSPRLPEPLEAAGKVVLTVSMWRAGRVAYRTYDGSCSVRFDAGGSPPNVGCSEQGKARSPEDYTAAAGELVFTAGGSKTITIPIADDDVGEGDQWFTLVAWEEVNADPWLDRGDSVVVSIIDDDGERTDGNAGSGGGAPARTAISVAVSRPAGSTSGAPVPPRTVPNDTPPVADLEQELASPVLQPGPGFELSSEEAPKPAQAPSGPGGRSGSPWLAPALVIAAASVIAAALMQRRRQWSPTRS